jgi:hypothetical protein
VAARAALVMVAAWLCLTPPLLLVFSQQASLFGVPILYLAVFVAWVVLVVLGASASRGLRG